MPNHQSLNTCYSRSHLVCVFEFEAGDDLALQLAVLARLVQNGLTEFGDVGSASFPQHRVQPVVWRRRRKRREEDEGGGGKGGFWFGWVRSGYVKCCIFKLLIVQNSVFLVCLLIFVIVMCISQFFHDRLVGV